MYQVRRDLQDDALGDFVIGRRELRQRVVDDQRPPEILFDDAHRVDDRFDFMGGDGIAHAKRHGLRRIGDLHVAGAGADQHRADGAHIGQRAHGGRQAAAELAQLQAAKVSRAAHAGDGHQPPLTGA